MEDALAYLKKNDPRLHAAALPHRAAVLSRVRPKRTAAALFSSLAGSIVSQQLSSKAAASIFARLKETLGGAVTPAAVRSAPIPRLRGAGLSEAKVRSLKELANAVDSGELKLLALKRLPPEEALARLTRIYGIGPWTAEMFLIFALGAPDVFSPGDLILARQMQKHLGLGEDVPKKELAAMAARWSPHRSFVSLLFWQLHHAEQDAKNAMREGTKAG
jgi:DNA-3-methyladenine glycosylase II